MILAFLILFQDEWEVPKLGLHFENAEQTISIDLRARQKLTLFIVPEEGATNLKKNGSLFYPQSDVFVDISAFERISLFLDVRIDRHIPPRDGSLQARPEVWWIRYETPLPFNLFLEFGKFPTPIGIFVPRRDTPQDVFPMAPLSYVTVTNFKPGFTEAQLLASRDFPRLDRYGRMLIWEDLYASGVLLFGDEGPFHYRVGVSNNAPSGPPKFWDFNAGDEGNQNVSGFFGVTPWIGLTLGVSFSTGAYLHEDEARIVWKDRTKLFHDLIGFGAEFSVGHFAAYAEYFYHHIEPANIADDLEAHSWYVELQYKILPGLAAGARVGQNLYSGLSGQTWDYDTVRVEGGAAWTIIKGLVLRNEFMITTTAHNDADDFMWVMQLIATF